MIVTKHLLFFLILYSLCTRLQSQSTTQKPWCASKCNAAGDEMKNTKAVYMKRSISRSSLAIPPTLTFPLHINIIQGANHEKISDSAIQNTIAKLNVGFKNAGIKFTIESIDHIEEELTIEDLYDSDFQLYRAFSSKYDKLNRISVFIFGHKNELCTITSSSISCGRTGGFSYILSEATNNVVLSAYDLEDDKIIVHEMAHFFGLYHTFEETMFGKDNFVEDCNIAGDCLCDTPPDPGSGFEVYVNHSLCEMKGYTHKNGNSYKPLIDNYMAYYKPCYLKPYAFTSDQLNILRLSAESVYRKKFSF